jgi:REP-associated tyrosine transposase
MFPRKPRRLAHDAYKGERLYFVTLLTESRRPVFSDPEVVSQCAAQFMRAAQATKFKIVAYCYMPDHLHILVRGMSGASDLIAFVKRAKQLSGYHGKRTTGRKCGGIGTTNGSYATMKIRSGTSTTSE